TSVYEQRAPEVVFHSATGGAYTVTIENHSGHRTNLYSIAAVRIPSEKKYADHDPTFRSDTSYETTWTVETRKRLVREEIVRDTSWRIEYDSTLIGVDTISEDLLDEEKYIPAGSSDNVSFDVPSDVDRWAYWVGAKEAYSAMKQLLGGTARVASVAFTGPLAAFAAGAISDLTASTSTNTDIGYTLSRWDGTTWVRFVVGGRVKQSFRRMDVAGSFSIELDNSYSVLTGKTVHVQVSAIKFRKNYSVQARNVPTVTTRKVPVYEDFNVNVPHVKLVETPRLPWSRR
ncbi:MAG: hypothetical protein ABIK86_06100, partial [candidate division WOR-3 bacterium]